MNQVVCHTIMGVSLACSEACPDGMCSFSTGVLFMLTTLRGNTPAMHYVFQYFPEQITLTVILPLLEGHAYSTSSQSARYCI